MAIAIVIFMLLCALWGLSAANKLFGIIKRKPKSFAVIKREPQTYIPEEIKPDPIPAVTNIQNNYTTNVIIVEASKN